MKSKIILFTLLLTCFETTKADDRVTRALNQISPAVAGACNYVGQKVTEIGPAVTGACNSIGQKVTEIGPAVTGACNYIGPKIKEIGPAFNDACNYVGPHLAALPQKMQNLADAGSTLLLAHQATNFIADQIGEENFVTEAMRSDRSFGDAATLALGLQAAAHPVRTAKLIHQGAKKGLELSKQYIPGINDVCNTVKNVAGKAQDAYGYLCNTANNAMGYVYPNPNNGGDEGENDAWNVHGQGLGPDEYPLDQHPPASHIINERANQGENVIEQRIEPQEHAYINPNNGGDEEAAMNRLLNKIKGDKKYDIPTWRTLCTLLQNASEQKKRAAIEKMGATSLVRDEYNNNVNNFLKEFQDELQNFNPPVNLRENFQQLDNKMNLVNQEENRGMTVNDLLNHMKQYIQKCIDTDLVKRSLVRNLIYQLKYLYAGSLFDLCAYFIAFSSAKEAIKGNAPRPNYRMYRYLHFSSGNEPSALEQAIEIKNLYSSALTPQDRDTFQAQIRTMVNNRRSPLYTNFSDFESPYVARVKPSELQSIANISIDPSYQENLQKFL